MRFNYGSIKTLSIILAGLLTLSGYSEVSNLVQSKERSIFQTVPTRTPTPEPVDPTATRRPPTPKPGEPTPTFSGPSHTGKPPTPILDLVKTPLGGYLPTAEACTEPPMVQVQDTVNVRSVPDSEAELVDQLVYLEVRQIIGRSSFNPWWLVDLGNGNSGWIIDEAVTVSGYTGNVPVADPVPMNNRTPTPSSSWSPTVQPQCPPLPTHTHTPPPTKTQEIETTLTDVRPGPKNSVTPTLSAGESASNSTNINEETGTATLSPSPTPSGGSPTANSELGEINREAEEEDEPGGSGISSNILLIAGVGLILLGIGIAIFRRFFPS